MADLRKIKLGFANPLQPGSDDMSYDPAELQDPISAHQIISAKEDVFKRRNVFKGMTEFVGLVILEPIIIETNSGVMDIISSLVGFKQNYYKFKIHIPELHAALGNPCDVGNFGAATESQAKQLMKAEKIIEHHPWITTKLPVDWTGAALPKFGDIIKVKFTKGPSDGRQIEGEFVGIISSGNADSIKSYCNAAVYEKFNSYSATAPSDSGATTMPRPLTLAEQNSIDGCKLSTDETKVPLSYGTVDLSESTNSSVVSLPDIAETTKYFNINNNVDLGLLDSEFLKRITVMAKVFNCATGQKVTINSGRRTKEQQQALVDTWKKAGGGPGTPTADGITIPSDPNASGWATGIGHSTGTAIDCGGATPGGAPQIIAALGDISQFGLQWGGEFNTPDVVHIQMGSSPALIASNAPIK